MDAKLKKLFDRVGQIKPAGWVSDEFCNKIKEELVNGCDHIVAVPSGLGKTNVGLRILAADPALCPVWYVAPSEALTPYKTAIIRNALADINLTVMTLSERDQRDTSVVIWSVEMLLHHLTAGFLQFPMPNLIILDDAEYIGFSSGPAIESLLLFLPKDVPLLLILSPIANPVQVVDWLKSLRNRPCRFEMTECSPVPKVPAFITVSGDMTTLLDKKGLSGKVKRLLREEIRFPAFSKLMQGIAAALKSEDLLPAAILLPEPSDCDQAVSALPSVKDGKTSGVLTDPSMAAILENNPFLKDYEPLKNALSKRAAACHAGHYPMFELLLEYLLGFKSVDIVFGDLDGLEKFSSRVKTVVLYVPGRESSEEKAFFISRNKMNRLARLAGRPGADLNGCIALAHAPRMDAVFLKDRILSISQPFFLKSRFQCDCQTVLRFLSRGPNPASLLEKTLFFAQRQPLGEFCLKSLNDQLQEEFPGARCRLHIKTVYALFELRVNLEIQVQKISGRLKERLPSDLREQRATEKKRLENILSLLPCEKCEHSVTCRRRGSRRLRKMIEEYDQMVSNLQESTTWLKNDLDRWLQALQETGYAGSDLDLTLRGRLALQTGMALPFGLVECIDSQLMANASPEIRFALLAGFVVPENPLSIPLMEELETAAESLAPFQHALTPVLNDMQERVLRFGILLPAFSFIQSCLLLRWKQRKDLQSLSRATSLPIGLIISLIQQTACLEERLLSLNAPELPFLAGDPDHSGAQSAGSCR